MIMCEVNDNTCGMFMSLLSMCEVMGLHMYIALVGLDLGLWVGLMMSLCNEVQVWYYWLFPPMMLFVVFTSMSS